MDRLPASTAARIDGLLPVVVRPMNGQEQRQRIVRSLAKDVRFDRVIETGTYRGGTTKFLADTFGVPVTSVEAVARYHVYARNRLAGDRRIRLTQGDTRAFLRKQADREEWRTQGMHSPPQTVFFYLDAHWEHDLPLADELRIIAATWSRVVVMIDDFQVPDDPGYGYDDYGPGKALTEGYLPDEVASWQRLYPTAPSDEETGARRGCVVLVSPAVRLGNVWELRSAHPGDAADAVDGRSEPVRG